MDMEYNMFRSYFDFNFDNKDTQNVQGAARPVRGRSIGASSYPWNESESRNESREFQLRDDMLMSRSSSESSDQSGLSLISERDEEVEDVFEHRPVNEDLLAGHSNEAVANMEQLQGSTNFYRNLNSTFYSIEENFNITLPSTPNVFDSNVQQRALSMLRSLTLNTTADDASSIVDNDNFLPIRNGRSLDVIKHCAFCKRNGETREFYSTHIVKDSRGKVVCPILRKYVCPICKATGNNAHTLRHCPFKIRTALQPTV